MSIPRVLTIAGSDSGGGAGIQADLKTFTALRVFGTTAITALTVQNTVEVSGILPVPAAFVAQQIDAVMEDIGTDAAKTGMLLNKSIIEAVADRVAHHQIPRLVVDPVMIAKSGAVLLEEDARQALQRKLLPLAYAVTPNLPEAAALTGQPVRHLAEMQEAARRLYDLGPQWIIIKGGHLDGPAIDIAYNGMDFLELPGERLNSRNTHGTGCTYSAALAAFLAQGLAMEEALPAAKKFVTQAIARGLNIGHGHGPLNHFLWEIPAT